MATLPLGVARLGEPQVAESQGALWPEAAVPLEELQRGAQGLAGLAAGQRARVQQAA